MGLDRSSLESGDFFGGGEGELIGVAIVNLCPLRTGAAGAPQLGSASPPPRKEELS